MSEAQLDRVGCFQYSPVQGARANDLPDHIPDDVKQDRWNRFMAHQQAISTERLAQKLRSEEHTSELQSLMRISYAVFCLKKKNKKRKKQPYITMRHKQQQQNTQT